MTTVGGQTSRFERICTTDGQSLPLVVLRPFVLLRSISLHFEYVNKFGFPLLLGGSLSFSLSVPYWRAQVFLAGTMALLRY